MSYSHVEMPVIAPPRCAMVLRTRKCNLEENVWLKLVVLDFSENAGL